MRPFMKRSSKRLMMRLTDAKKGEVFSYGYIRNFCVAAAAAAERRELAKTT
jgi:hypothetical protein